MHFWCSPQGGAFAHYFKPHRGVFVWTARPHRGAKAAFPKKMTNVQKMSREEMGMLGIDWASIHVHSHKCIGCGSENGRRWNSFLLHVAQVKTFDSLTTSSPGHFLREKPWGRGWFSQWNRLFTEPDTTREDIHSQTISIIFKHKCWDMLTADHVPVVFVKKVVTFSLTKMILWKSCFAPGPFSGRSMCIGSRGPSEFLSLPAVRLEYVTKMHWPRRAGKTPCTVALCNNRRTL